MVQFLKAQPPAQGQISIRRDMVFGGIQKLTLLDYPDKTACTLFAIGCDFRCPFCHNASLLSTAKSRQKVSGKEIFDFLKMREGLLDGVCISGGEPLLHDDIGAFISEIKELGYLVKLDTNGSRPGKLEKLISSGAVDYIAMDIKNAPEKYAVTIGVPGYDISPVEESITLLLSCNVPYEFRTTVVSDFHTGDDLLAIASWIAGAKKYTLQKFTDSGEVLQSGLTAYSDEEMRQLLQSVKKIIPAAELRGV